MKISILVQSPLLERTLQLYLREFLANYDECDFVVSDTSNSSASKPICLISFGVDSDISRPFCKQTLMRDLERFTRDLGEIERVNVAKFDSVLDLGELASLKESLDLINGANKDDSEIRKEIDAITQDFAQKLYEVIKKGAK